MSFSKSKPEAVLLLFIASSITFLFLYGLATRPVIAYTLLTPLEYNGTHDFGFRDLIVNLKMTNDGLSPVRVELTVRLYNMSLTEPKEAETFIGEGFTAFRVILDDPIRKKEDATYNIKLRSTGEATYLVLIFTVESQPLSDPITSFYDSFAIYSPERPNALLLKHIEKDKFMRVRGRY